MDIGREQAVNLSALSANSSLVQLKQASYELLANKAYCLQLANTLVIAKIKRQWLTIYNLHKLYAIDHMDISAALAKLSLQRATPCTSIQSLLGFEGQASKCYFAALKHFMPKWSGFTKRVKRPPTDPANAILSFCYVLFSSEINRQLITKGFDPAFGVMHQPTDYRPSLTCDVMELFRAKIDIWVIIMLRTSLNETHFTYRDDKTKSVLLNAEGKKAFYPAWQVMKKRLLPSLTRLLRFTRYQVLKGGV
jgi:CRISPR-associated protein Cas1